MSLIPERVSLLPPPAALRTPLRGLTQRWVIVLLFVVFAAVLVPVSLANPLAAIVAIYVPAFWWLAWKHPAIALLLIFAACPFQTDVSGGGFAKYSVAEVNMVLSIPVFILQMIVRKRLPVIGPIAVPVLLYFAVCGYSSSLHWLGQDAILSLVQMFLYFVIVVAVFASFAPRLEDLRKVLWALVVVGVFLSVAGMATHYTFIGLNKNGIGASLSVALLVTVDLWLSEPKPRNRQRLLVALGIISIGLLISLSRGSWMGFLVGVFAIFALRRQWKSLGRLVVILVPLVALGWLFIPADSQNYATSFGKSSYNIEARYKSVDLAQTIFKRSPIYGEGVGLRKQYDATNVVWMALAETGVLGLAAFLLIHTAFLSMILRTQRRLPVLHPHFSLLTVGAALILDQLSHGMVDHYWSRGAIMAAWAAAGMAVGVYYRHRNNPICR